MNCSNGFVKSKLELRDSLMIGEGYPSSKRGEVLESRRYLARSDQTSFNLQHRLIGMCWVWDHSFVDTINQEIHTLQNRLTDKDLRP